MSLSAQLSIASALIPNSFQVAGAYRGLFLYYKTFFAPVANFYPQRLALHLRLRVNREVVVAEDIDVIADHVANHVAYPRL